MWILLKFLYIIYFTAGIKLIWSLVLSLSILFLIFIGILPRIYRYSLIDSIDWWVKNNQKLLIYLPVFLAIFSVLICFLSLISTEVLVALVSSITFIFTLINVYISNYWNEIANHRNTTLINVPYIDFEWTDDGCAYKNVGGTAVKYLKLYENDVKKNERYYSVFNDGVVGGDNKKHRVKNTTKSNDVCIDTYIYSVLKNKFKQEKNYSNILIHTDFSQRNIFLIYTCTINGKPFSKRFTPMSYDMNYEVLVGQEKITEVIRELPIENKDNEIEFINCAIENYTNLMKY